MDPIAVLADSPERTAILLDVDGTLAPIVPRPEEAAVPAETRAELERLARRYRLLAFVSGRTGDDARRMVGVSEAAYVGVHGLELEPEAAMRQAESIAKRAWGAGLVPRFGRKVLEVRPPVDADKGTAVRALVSEAGVSRALFAGDDTTDLDA